MVVRAAWRAQLLWQTPQTCLFVQTAKGFMQIGWEELTGCRQQSLSRLHFTADLHWCTNITRTNGHERKWPRKRCATRELSRQIKCIHVVPTTSNTKDIWDKKAKSVQPLSLWLKTQLTVWPNWATLTLLSSFFIVTKSRDFSECPVGAMKYKHAWMRVSW